MQTTKLTLHNGIGLTCVTSKRARIACLSAMLALPLGNEARSLRALLPHVLRESSRRCAGRQAVATRLDELYGARLEPVVRKRGEAQLIGFVADVIDERYAMRGDSGLFAGTARLLADLLLDPGDFSAETVERERAHLCDRIRSLPDDKRTWAVRRMYQYMCADEAYSVVELGEEDALRAATPEALRRQYEDVLTHAPLELFYYGSLEAQQAARLLDDAFAAKLPVCGLIRPAFDAPRTAGPLRTVKEEEPVRQGKLSIGLRTGITAFDADYPAMVVFNACFGGTTSSRLFRTVREEMSLCYYASSQTDKLKGVMAVSSGLENVSAPKAQQEILRQLADMQNGGLTAAEVTAAKQSVTASLRAMRESPLAMENYYQTQAAAGLSETVDALIARIEAVTPEQVAQAARKATPDTIYFLKGAQI